MWGSPDWSGLPFAESRDPVQLSRVNHRASPSACSGANSRSRFQLALAAVFALCTLLSGCATPRLLPPDPLPPQPAEFREYDADHDGKPDFTEFLHRDRIAAIAFGDSAARRIDLTTVSTDRSPHLLFILDSVPFELVRDAWNAGRFRYFHRPAQIISVFPAMTDPAIAEFFHVSPCPGVEAVHFDGRRLITGYDAYLAETNAPWLACVNYYLHPSDHAVAYLMPGTTFRRELAEAQIQFAAFARAPQTRASQFIAYSVATSGLGSADGRAGHEYALEMLDRYCRRINYDCRGDVQITLMSDHGHDFTPHRRIDMAAELKNVGYRVGQRLESDGDVVVPAFGLVSCVAIHTLAPEKVARDCLRIPGVEFAMFRSPPAASPDSREIVILSRGASARLTRRKAGYRYEPVEGDPLNLQAILAGLPANAEGFVDDAAMFRASAEHEFPDPLDRIWHAFNGLFANTPDVLLSLDNESYAGSADLAVWLDMLGVHGSLRADSTNGFLMTTRHELPPVLRMRDARAALRTRITLPTNN